MRVVRVVAWGGGLLPGTVLERHEHLAKARAQGAVLLPADADLIEVPTSGADGWAKREWGEGFEPSAHTPSRCCPIAVRIEPGRGFVHWAIQLMFVTREAPVGSLRLGFDTAQRGTIAPASQTSGPPIDLASTVAEGVPGMTRTFVGLLPADVRIDGLLGLSVYGAARGVRIRKVAVSVCSREV